MYKQEWEADFNLNNLIELLLRLGGERKGVEGEREEREREREGGGVVMYKQEWEGDFSLNNLIDYYWGGREERERDQFWWFFSIFF